MYNDIYFWLYEKSMSHSSTNSVETPLKYITITFALHVMENRCRYYAEYI